jgi:hypothetical protein
MPIIDDVSAQMKDAMRAREKARLQALRNIRAAFLSALKADGSETLTDEQCIPILRKLAKQRNESIQAFDSGGRPEMAADERAELAVIDTFLPSLADEATTRGWVEAAISSTGATSQKEFGRVMGMVMKAHKADVDANLAKRIISELLS